MKTKRSGKYSQKTGASMIIRKRKHRFHMTEVASPGIRQGHVYGANVAWTWTCQSCVDRKFTHISSEDQTGFLAQRSHILIIRVTFRCLPLVARGGECPWAAPGNDCAASWVSGLMGVCVSEKVHTRRVGALARPARRRYQAESATSHVPPGVLGADHWRCEAFLAASALGPPPS
jgi:hypothetical protein